MFKLVETTSKHRWISSRLNNGKILMKGQQVHITNTPSIPIYVSWFDLAWSLRNKENFLSIGIEKLTKHKKKHSFLDKSKRKVTLKLGRKEYYLAYSISKRDFFIHLFIIFMFVFSFHHRFKWVWHGVDHSRYSKPTKNWMPPF